MCQTYFHSFRRNRPHCPVKIDLTNFSAENLAGSRGSQDQEFKRRRAAFWLLAQLGHEGDDLIERQRRMMPDSPHLLRLRQQMLEVRAPPCWIGALAISPSSRISQHGLNPTAH